MGDSRVTTNAGEFWFEDGTLKVRATRKEVSSDDVREAFEALREALAGRPEVKRALVDLGVGFKMDRRARADVAEANADLRVDKAALVFHNPVQRIAASFFLGINKPAGDIRLFESFEEAEDWLRE